VTGFGDLVPQVSLRWNSGVHNWMTSATGDIPVGAYDSTRLANLRIGHGAIDFGGGLHLLQPADRPRNRMALPITSAGRFSPLGLGHRAALSYGLGWPRAASLPIIITDKPITDTAPKIAEETLLVASMATENKPPIIPK
jgi:hypothetical protein